MDLNPPLWLLALPYCSVPRCQQQKLSSSSAAWDGKSIKIQNIVEETNKPASNLKRWPKEK